MSNQSAPRIRRSNSISSIVTALPPYEKEDPHEAPPAWSAPISNRRQKFQTQNIQNQDQSKKSQNIQSKQNITNKVPQRELRERFEEILEKVRPQEFASYRVSQGATNFFPSAEEVVAHLKLLRAFAVLKKKITGTLGETKTSVKIWQVFVTYAVRRFIIYLSALKKALGLTTNDSTDEEEILNRDKNEYLRISSFLRSILPPLDVLMVWHTFSLNPRAYYDFLVRNQFCQFYATTFPLDLVNSAICNSSFKYDPPRELREGYISVIEGFSPNETDLDYSLHGFDPRILACDILCPICQETLLAGVPFTNDSGSGFADIGFKMRKLETKKGGCDCDFDPTISHESLRCRQLYADLSSRKLLPNTYRYFSTIIKNEAYRVFVTKEIAKVLKPDIAKEVLPILSRADIDTCVRAIANCNHAYSKKVILRHYYMMNLVHLTVRGGMEVAEDLVGCVMRQERFWQKMNEIDWLNSPSIEMGISEARRRYKRFYRLLTAGNNRGSLIPTMDIDFLWHTEQLSQHHYITECKEEISEYLIDHDDKAETGLIHDAFISTARVYGQKYQAYYTVCSCWYCDMVRNGSQTKQLWKSRDSKKPDAFHPIFCNSCEPVGLSHLSLHDAIELPSLAQFRGSLELTYAKRGSLPWVEDRRKLGYALFAGQFVLPPLIPINHSFAFSSCIYETLHPETIQAISSKSLEPETTRNEVRK